MCSQQRACRLDDTDDDAHRVRVLGRPRRRRGARNGTSAGGGGVTTGKAIAMALVFGG